jgi:hypothetical protein
VFSSVVGGVGLGSCATPPWRGRSNKPWLMSPEPELTFDVVVVVVVAVSIGGELVSVAGKNLDGIEHPANPSAARRSWARWSSTRRSCRGLLLSEAEDQHLGVRLLATFKGYHNASEDDACEADGFEWA